MIPCTRTNRVCFEKLQVFFPLLFYIGCVVHYCDHLIKDLIKIKEIVEIVDEARKLSKFVKTHKYVCALFKQRIKGKSAMLTLFPKTRFAYVISMLEHSQKIDLNLSSECARPRESFTGTQKCARDLQMSQSKCHFNDV